MPKRLFTLTDELDKRLKAYAERRYGNKKGSRSIIIQDALDEYLSRMYAQIEGI